MTILHVLASLEQVRSKLETNMCGRGVVVGGLDWKRDLPTICYHGISVLEYMYDCTTVARDLCTCTCVVGGLRTLVSLYDCSKRSLSWEDTGRHGVQ